MCRMTNSELHWLSIRKSTSNARKKRATTEDNGKGKLVWVKNKLRKLNCPSPCFPTDILMLRKKS